VAAEPQRTLIGVRQDGEGGLRIWGLINSGTRWLRDVQGGRRAGAPLPSAPVVPVNAPGSIECHRQRRSGPDAQDHCQRVLLCLPLAHRLLCRVFSDSAARELLFRTHL
jgi:hypothetical protein